MHPLKVWQEWTDEVGRLASCATVWQPRALALFSLGLAVVQDCSMEQVTALIAEVAAWVPSGTRVVLLTDRGLSWPALVDQCRRVGWSFLLRVQQQTRVRTSDGRTQAIGDLAPRPGTLWQGSGCAFK